MNLVQAYERVILSAMRDGSPRRHERVVVEAEIAGPPVLISWSGFYPNRWVAYCDDYLDGGPALDAWCASPDRTFEFLNGACHARGPCVTSMRLDAGTLHLASRACAWVPTGILDLKLAQLAAERVGATRLLWVIDDLQLEPATVVSYHLFSDLDGSHEFARRARQLVADTPDGALDKRMPGMLGRHKKAIRRARTTLTTDESRIRSAFTLAVPRDFVWAGRGRFSESWVTRVTGRRGYGEYQWDRLDYPGLDVVLGAVGRSVSLAGMATTRARRG